MFLPFSCFTPHLFQAMAADTGSVEPMTLPPEWIRALSPNISIRGCIANEILPGVWLGRAEFALDEANLQRAGITHVITVANDTPGDRPMHSDSRDRRSHPLYVSPTEVQAYLEARTSRFAYLCLAVGDFGTDVGISRTFDTAFACMDEALSQGGAVFVHCANGSNRSPTLVLGYVMHRQSCSLQVCVSSPGAPAPAVCA